MVAAYQKLLNSYEHLIYIPVHLNLTTFYLTNGLKLLSFLGVFLYYYIGGKIYGTKIRKNENKKRRRRKEEEGGE